MNVVINFLQNLRDTESRNKIVGIPGLIVSLLAVIWSLFHLYTGYFPLMAMYQRIVFVAFALVIIFVTHPLWGKKAPTKLNIQSIVLGALVVGISIYLWINYTVRAEEIGMVNYTTDIVLGTILLILVLDACRRTSGWAFTIVSLCLILYARFGEWLPSIFAHKNYDYERIISGLFLTTEGFYGPITGVTATFIFIFVLFGSFLKYSGAGTFFMDICNALLGKTRGGAAKVAVVASSLFGMMSGSALANVAGIGQFTIPLMKKTGYTPHYAGAVESCASSGGQLMPPVMGGSAFIMMEILGVSYFFICKSASIIAILFYVALFIMVDLAAVKQGLKGLSADELPSKRETLKNGWHFALPIIILVVCLASDMSASRAAFWATISIPIVSLLRKHGRMGVKEIFGSLEDAAYTSATIAGIVIAMGIVVGMVTLTGLGLTLSEILISLAGGNLFALLMLAMLTSLLLGMGVPIICAYIILSVLVCPALIALGVEPIAAHLFVFYFAILSAITPPVAPAAYIAAGIADAPMMKTAFTACKIGLGLIILPFIMVYDTGLIMMGSWFDIIAATTRALASIFALAFFLEGQVFKLKINWAWRFCLLIAAIGFITPQLWTTIVGYVILGVAFGYAYLIANKKEEIAQ